MRWARGPIGDRTAFATLSAAGLLTLCRCSLLFNVSGLQDRGTDDTGLDATSDGAGPAPTALASPGSDAAPEEAAAEAGETEAAADDGSVEDGPGDAPALVDAETEASDAAGEAESVDAPGVSISDAVESGAPDATLDAPVDAGAPDALGTDTGVTGVPPDGGDFTTAGLVAYYPFDETSGTTSVDASGHGYTAAMMGATFSTGVEGNAATMNGMMQYVALPAGIVNGLTSFSVSAWLNLQDTTVRQRIFDFGSSASDMFLWDETKLQFAIKMGSAPAQVIVGPMTQTAEWEHVVVTLAGTTGTFYFNGTLQPNANTSMTLNPASLGSTPQNWIGRSEVTSDAYLTGQVDNFRIYDRALSATEVQALFAMKL